MLNFYSSDTFLRRAFFSQKLFMAVSFVNMNMNIFFFFIKPIKICFIDLRQPFGCLFFKLRNKNEQCISFRQSNKAQFSQSITQCECGGNWPWTWKEREKISEKRSRLKENILLAFHEVTQEWRKKRRNVYRQWRNAIEVRIILRNIESQSSVKIDGVRSFSSQNVIC